MDRTKVRELDDHEKRALAQRVEHRDQLQQRLKDAQEALEDLQLGIAGPGRVINDGIIWEVEE